MIFCYIFADVEEEIVWKHFNECGRILNVRIIRDNKTSLGKGFGYVEFDVSYPI